MTTKIVTKNGVKYIEIDGKIVDTLSMKSFRPTKNNVSDFYKAGVRIFHVYCSGLTSALKVPYSLYGETWFGDKDYRFENLDRQIEMFKENAPDGYVFINVHLDSRQWWHDQNPGRSKSFTHLSQIAADEKWRRDTADYLKALISHVEEKYDDYVIGYFLLGGHTTEWFSDHDYEETHPIKLEAFRKYMNDEKAYIPLKIELEKPENQIFLDPEKDRTVIDYRIFHNKLIADTVLYYAAAAQEVLNHKKVVGLFFGYILELLHERLWNAGHIDIDRIYRSKDIDLIATPSSYQFREYNDASAYMLLSDTLELNDKMYFCSFDHMTFKVPHLTNEPRRICGEDKAMEAMSAMAIYRKDLLTTVEQTRDAIHREFMQRIQKRTGMWWFDMLEGWFYDDGIMEEITKVVDTSKDFVGFERKSASEIAVIISCESMYYVNKCSKMNTELICNQRDALARMGAPYDIYSMNDIDRIDPDQYKLYIFLDAYYMTDEQREYINKTIKNGGRNVMFVGGADYVNDEGFSLDRVCDMTGFDVEIMEKDEKSINAYNTTFGYADAKTPTLYVNDKDAEILGRYTYSRLAGLVKKNFENYTMYFSGIGNFSASVLREIARQSGVHIYTENDIPVFVNSKFFGVYNTRSEFSEIDLGFDGEFEEIFTGKVYKTQNGKITLPTGEYPAQMIVVK